MYIFVPVGKKGGLWDWTIPDY